GGHPRYWARAVRRSAGHTVRRRSRLGRAFGLGQLDRTERRTVQRWGSASKTDRQTLGRLWRPDCNVCLILVFDLLLRLTGFQCGKACLNLRLMAEIFQLFKLGVQG